MYIIGDETSRPLYIASIHECELRNNDLGVYFLLKRQKEP
jgi:hypothetical protein